MLNLFSKISLMKFFFADRLSKNDDKSAAIGFIYSLLEAERMGKISYKKSNFISHKKMIIWTI